jgi:hypothetical protein
MKRGCALACDFRTPKEIIHWLNCGHHEKHPQQVSCSFDWNWRLIDRLYNVEDIQVFKRRVELVLLHFSSPLSLVFDTIRRRRNGEERNS